MMVMQRYNNVLSQISAKYYVLINSDIQVTKDWLYPIIRLMDNDKNISACQPKILDYKKKKDLNTLVLVEDLLTI